MNDQVPQKADPEKAQELLSRLTKLKDIIACPKCKSRISIAPETLSCSKCGALYPVQNGIPLLAVQGSTETWSTEAEANTSKSYQQNYQNIDCAEEYNVHYERHLFKRMSTKREYALLNRLLGSQPHCKTILDLPSGGGRLSAQIASHTDLLIEADIALGQVQYGSRKPVLTTPQAWITASAFHIPFDDNSIDGVVSCRLCHHLPTAMERERLISELIRVSKRFVIMTFFDHHSLKNTLSRIRLPFNGKPGKMTMTIKRVQELARENNARLTACPMLAALSSGHRYALIVKDN